MQKQQTPAMLAKMQKQGQKIIDAANGTSEGVRKAWLSRQRGRTGDVEHHRSEAHDFAKVATQSKNSDISTDAAGKASFHAGEASEIAESNPSKFTHNNAAQAHDHAADAQQGAMKTAEQNGNHGRAIEHGENMQYHKTEAVAHRAHANLFK